MKYFKLLCQSQILRILYRLFPFDIHGDLELPLSKGGMTRISCLIPAAFRPQALDDLLADLAAQTLPVSEFDVVVVNDGGQSAISAVITSREQCLSLKEIKIIPASRCVGRVRNRSILEGKGDIYLLLDDDTRLPDRGFLKCLIETFGKRRVDVIRIKGKPLPISERKGYLFLDSYSFATRCCAYRRNFMIQLGGFFSNLKGYEDIELGIRATILKARVYDFDDIEYLHPAFYFHNWDKPIAIGQSIMAIRKRYSFPVWLLVWLNAIRFIPYIAIPSIKHRQWAKISLGVLLAPFMKKERYY